MVDIDRAHLTSKIKKAKKAIKRLERFVEQSEHKKKKLRTLAIVNSSGDESFIEYTDAKKVSENGRDFIKLTNKFNKGIYYLVELTKNA